MNRGPINIGTMKPTLTACSTVEAELMAAIRFEGKEDAYPSIFNIKLSL